ncbi:hypothetical protein BKA82DRAFT_378118 [Pisolithus tinctorius]|uniref:Uncharacterized protein n=1 Tax=Pisolithus tinctorius Marx 270 TaxID=870435 RepID=A0A0C3KED3_PISTI|nr:hypothetical protein BKA82DRAFT_378118 [Pisolithus tinctorius]KIO07962.1 hypothetical protein M404DRAFT_378118 [Pisolithus tinctorius Marx 270]
MMPPSIRFCLCIANTFHFQPRSQYYAGGPTTDQFPYRPQYPADFNSSNLPQSNAPTHPPATVNESTWPYAVPTFAATSAPSIRLAGSFVRGHRYTSATQTANTSRWRCRFL